MLDLQKIFAACPKSFRHLLNWCALLISALLLVTMGTVSTPIAQAATASQVVTLPESVSPQITQGKLIGHHNAGASITIGVLMQTNNSTQMYGLLKALYNRQSPLYHQWLKKGEFAQRFGPTSSQLAAVTSFLTHAGLRIVPSTVGNMAVLASGTSGQIEAAFHTTINDYRMSNGTVFFANSSNLQIPATLQGALKGIFGLCNAPTAHPISLQVAKNHPHYGGGPNGSGLTPSQIASIYDATPLSKAGNTGQGVTLAVYELSGYTRSDILTYESQFGLPNVPLRNIAVQGGPLNNSGAGEVELDIELQIALTPGAKSILVYNAPNNELGVILEYLQIAADNAADAISTSWGTCELRASSLEFASEEGASIVMALQGQSIFAASGDDGAFDCLRQGDNTLQVDDPASQPYFTGVGGTSLAGFDPGPNPNPTYPAGVETIWNNNCLDTGCGGGGGGGVSRHWADPGFQFNAPGVAESGFSQSGSYCKQPSGVPCREVPDVSLNADPASGYSIFCTDPGDLNCGGWTQFGGTSAAAPLWASIAALLDAHFGVRTGLFTFFAYKLDSSGYGKQLHDITSGNNGFYPAGADYDMGSGLGTCDIALFVQNP